MCIFKNKSNMLMSMVRYLCILILIVFCGIIYSCEKKDEDSEIKIEQASHQIYDEEENDSTNRNDETENNKIICVHITGYVANPGVYDVTEGARIYEVVRLAGGFLPEADESYLNLASIVSDGQKIQVLSKEEAATAKPFVSQTDNETTTKLININTASKEELMQLPGIGESRAVSIISYREKNGSFGEITDIMKISGIKEAAFEKIKDYICVE